ncbi:twitching motility protein PilI [Amphritea atlantica]|jgi:chemotaxis signal transduction protein|uniref:Twitching motility protein PilI n=1 Tax=Amphritea atlantica TaxID=355243 RepID=A0A1H9E4E3_9GAMM|nr:chemotaxis protein CheW [Amphritea atlantica]SEQ20594.1 twitching motility protein PilI [Amphritea atlantica]
MEQHNITADSAAETQGQYDLRHGFRVGFLQLLLQPQVRSELHRCERLCAIPDTPDWFVGFINHRGDAVPVYDLAASLGLGITDPKKGWLLLLDAQPATAAVLLQETPQGITNPGRADAPCPDLLDGISSGEYRYQNSIWFEFDHRAYFSRQKQRFIKTDSALPA